MNPIDPSAPSSCRRGKIARLPASLRHGLNLRLENNEPASTLLDWLNGVAETRLVLDRQFGGAPISAQNLSEWRQGGFREWLLLQELMDHAARFHDGAQAVSLQCGPQTLADNLATMVAARYAALLNTWDGEITPEFEAKIRFLRGLTHDVTQLQKSLHRAAQQSRDLERQKKDDAAQDLAQTKKAMIARIKADGRCGELAVRHGEKVSRAIVAVENAENESEARAAFPCPVYDPIQPNQTTSNQFPPAHAHAFAERLNTEILANSLQT